MPCKAFLYPQWHVIAKLCICVEFDVLVKCGFMYSEVSVYADNFVTNTTYYLSLSGVAYKRGICGLGDSYVGGRLLCCIWG